jgi:hypothetical protein
VLWIWIDKTGFDPFLILFSPLIPRLREGAYT